MADKTIQVITRASDGSLKIKEYEDFDQLNELHEQIGIDDCSTDLSLRGLPLFRGLIGPITENKTTVRYESPDVFETLTKEWSQAKVKRRRRRRKKVDGEEAKPAKVIPIPNLGMGQGVPNPTTNV